MAATSSGRLVIDIKFVQRFRLVALRTRFLF
jgi:hypothetical protein